MGANGMQPPNGNGRAVVGCSVGGMNESVSSGSTIFGQIRVKDIPIAAKWKDSQGV
jgi:hypothetical protein